VNNFEKVCEQLLNSMRVAVVLVRCRTWPLSCLPQPRLSTQQHSSRRYACNWTLVMFGEQTNSSTLRCSDQFTQQALRWLSADVHVVASCPNTSQHACHSAPLAVQPAVANVCTRPAKCSELEWQGALCTLAHCASTLALSLTGSCNVCTTLPS
jgi:hypothetical protein